MARGHWVGRGLAIHMTDNCCFIITCTGNSLLCPSVCLLITHYFFLQTNKDSCCCNSMAVRTYTCVSGEVTTCCERVPNIQLR
jgi:hypothetical protein